MELITLVGLKGSGKDTVGQYFEQQHGYTTISFADSLKDCVAAIFGWDRTMMEGRTPKSRIWREENDTWWAERLGLEFFSPRVAMTSFGTDIMRKHFDDNIWLHNTERKIQEISGPVVITDTRFPNELEMIRNLGGKVFRVTRGRDPDWFELAQQATGHDAELRMCAAHELHALGIHESEWLLVGAIADHTLNNDMTIADLWMQCEKLMPPN